MSDYIPSVPCLHNLTPFYDKSIFKGAFNTNSAEYMNALKNEDTRMRATGLMTKGAQARIIVCYWTRCPIGSPQLFHRDHPICITTALFDQFGNALSFYAVVRTTSEWVDTPGILERSMTVEAHITPRARVDWSKTTPWPITPAYANYVEPHQFEAAGYRPIPLREVAPNYIVYTFYNHETLTRALVEDEQVRGSAQYTRILDTCYLDQNSGLPVFGMTAGNMTLDVIAQPDTVTGKEMESTTSNTETQAVEPSTASDNLSLTLNPMPTLSGIRESGDRVWWS